MVLHLELGLIGRRVGNVLRLVAVGGFGQVEDVVGVAKSGVGRDGRSWHRSIPAVVSIVFVVVVVVEGGVERVVLFV